MPHAKSAATTQRLSMQSTRRASGSTSRQEPPMLHTRILGTGFVTGEHLIKNDDLTKMMDTSDQWIRERSGVEERYYVEAGTSTSDLGVAAARKALDDAGVAAAEVDYIVFATMTPDHFFPGCGGILQHNIRPR